MSVSYEEMPPQCPTKGMYNGKPYTTKSIVEEDGVIKWQEKNYYAQKSDPSKLSKEVKDRLNLLMWS
jgi:hypothetical protein